MKIDLRPVRNIEDYNRIIAGLKSGRLVAFQVKQNGRPRFITIKVP